jgi:hypothetical protein
MILLRELRRTNWDGICFLRFGALSPIESRILANYLFPCAFHELRDGVGQTAFEVHPAEG